MIISRTPFRVSFFGGGTDYPDWYLKNGGSVLSTTIDKYCYVTTRELPPFFDHKYRIAYSVVENVKTISEIQHPAVRAALEQISFTHGMEIHADADLPARAGLGSSSTFLVGLINCLTSLEGRVLSKHELAMEAIFVEQKIMRDSVGSQDQIAAAYGGFNRIDFNCDGTILVHPLRISNSRLNELNGRLMLFFTGFSRTASDIARHKISNLYAKSIELVGLRDLVDEGIKVLTGEGDLREFGDLLRQSWLKKKNLSEMVSNGQIDNIFQRALNAGAIGGKILGAGGGGFMLLYVEPDLQNNVKVALSECTYVPFSFDRSGSQIIYRQ